MRRKCSIIVSVLLTPFALATAAPATGAASTFDAPESIAAWSFSNGDEYPGATGALEWSADQGHAKPGAMALHFNFEKGGNYVAAITNLPPDPPINAVRFWARKPGNNKFIVRATDSSGQTFQKNIRYVYPGWQHVLVTLDGWVHSWGGAGDNQPRSPYRDFHILIESDGSERTGTVFLDGIEFLSAPLTSPDSSRVATYQATGFGPDDRWNIGAPGQGRLDAGSWHYAFPEGNTQIRLTNEFSLLAKPLAMSVTVESDGPGHELAVVLGSHFQLFEKTLGALTKKGRTVFDVPLGDMKTWRHYGGEDDGICRLPLRVLAIVLYKKGESSSGTVQLHAMNVTSEYEAGRAIELIPSVQPKGDSVAAFSVQLRSLLEEPLTAKLHWSMHDADNRIKTGAGPVTIPALGPPAVVRLTMPRGKAGVLEGRFQLDAPNQQCPELSCTISPVPDDPGPAAMNPESRMGAGLYLYRFHGHPDYRNKVEQMCALAQRAGVKWTREEFHWNWIETKKGEFDWSYFDFLVETTAKHGISIYGLMCYWTAWTEPNSDKGFDDYCDYLATAVDRYKGRINHWEIWNEPNVFFWSGTRGQYVELLKRAYATVKRVDPNAQVLGCSTAGIDNGFIQFVLDHDGPMDALTVHPYRGDLNTTAFIRELHNTKKQVGGRDIWITEMGWPSNIGAFSERAQAGYVARTYLSAFASNAVRSVSWYDFREDGDDPFYNEHHFGLVRCHDMTPKMGYRALATVGRLFDGLTCTRTPRLGDDVEAFVFADKAQQVIAVWTTGPSRLVALEVSDPVVKLRNIVGDTMPVGQGEAYKAFLLQKGQPVYFCGPPGFEVRSLDPPLRVTVTPKAVHPGNPVTVKLVADVRVKSLDLMLPAGWPKPSAGKLLAASLRTGLSVAVPETAAAGEHTITLIITGETGEKWEIPATISVAPQLIRA